MIYLLPDSTVAHSRWDVRDGERDDFSVSDWDLAVVLKSHRHWTRHCVPFRAGELLRDVAFLRSWGRFSDQFGDLRSKPWRRLYINVDLGVERAFSLRSTRLGKL